MFYVYLLESAKSKGLYTGYTSDLKKRLEEHNQKRNISTKAYAPWKLIYYEAFLDTKDAKRREYYLKTTQGKRLIKRKLKEYFYKSKH